MIASSRRRIYFAFPALQSLRLTLFSLRHGIRLPSQRSPISFNFGILFTRRILRLTHSSIIHFSECPYKAGVPSPVLSLSRFFHPGVRPRPSKSKVGALSFGLVCIFFFKVHFFFYRLLIFLRSRKIIRDCSSRQSAEFETRPLAFKPSCFGFSCASGRPTGPPTDLVNISFPLTLTVRPSCPIDDRSFG